MGEKKWIIQVFPASRERYQTSTNLFWRVVLFGRFGAGRKSQDFLLLFNLVVQVKVDFTGSGKEALYEAN